MLPHRKTIRHYDLPGHARELTFSCYRRLPLLADDQRRRMLSRSIDQAIGRHLFQLVAFVFMPEHVHLIVFPLGIAKVQDLLYAIKRPFSYRVQQLLIQQCDPLLYRLTIRERPGKFTFRFWQEGPGYDRNLVSLESLHVAIDYLHNNPVRRRLCDSAELWKWSSWSYYHQPDRAFDPDLPMVHGYSH